MGQSVHYLSFLLRHTEKDTLSHTRTLRHASFSVSTI